MSQELLKSVQDKLNEEQWTRAAIGAYSINEFKALLNVVNEAQSKGCLDELKAICDDHLSHTKNSIIALFISGMISLRKKNLDDSALIDLVNIFIDNKKMPVVEHICCTILEEDENNKFALRTLASTYKDEGNEKYWDCYVKIVKVDHNEAELARTLAEKYEKDGDTESAVEYYKKALLRYINQEQTAKQITDTWAALVKLIPEEIDFFYMIIRKISKRPEEATLQTVKPENLLHELYNYYHDVKNYDKAIEILKRILEYDQSDNWARKEIVECFRAKYEKHTQLEDYIKQTSLEKSYRNVFEAINDFEKRIAFDVKNFVFHRSWGVGIIRKVDKQEIVVNFGKTYGIKTMSHEMAVKALQPLDRNHIWVLKATMKREDLAKKIQDDIEDSLKIIIRSFNNNCSFKRIKEELNPSVLVKPSDWTSWSTKARKILAENPIFGVNQDDSSMYTVRDHEITPEEKLANEFKAQKNFFSRIDILMKFNNSEETDKESEHFTEMLNYFVGYLKSFSNVNEQIIASYLVVRRIGAENPQLNQKMQYSFAELFGEIEDPREIYDELKDTKNTYLKKDYLSCIKDLLPDWDDVYVRLFPRVLQQELLDALENNGHVDKLKKLALNCFENYRDYREAVIFFFEESQEEEWFKELNLSYEKQMITLIHILDIAYREIDNHCDTTENRKIDRKIQNLLFKNDTMLNYMLDHDEETVTRLFALVYDLKGFDSSIKQNMLNKIRETYKDFKVYGEEEKTVTTKGLIVTLKMFEAKKAELDNLKKVLIPDNAREIAEAMAQGDLKENAEYKAAKEKQTQLSAQLTKLEDGIGKAKVFDPKTLTTSRVSFGTIVVLKNELENKEEKYTILGPWESDPSNGIISYSSPLGGKILDSKLGETREFILSEENKKYTILSIEPANLA